MCPSSSQDHHWQLIYRQAIRNLPQLNAVFGTNLSTSASDSAYPVWIPRPFAQHILAAGPQSALWRQFIPSEAENPLATWGALDPIGDQRHFVAPQLIHRYHNRALFLPTNRCPGICRYCFRKNELSQQPEIFRANFPVTLRYLQQHTEINELIFSGGDPFILGNRKLDFYLQAFAQISHLRWIRFHVRTPIILPERIEPSLLALLDRYQSVFQKITIIIHINHPAELNRDNLVALKSLLRPSVQLLSQTVLLKNINDDPQILSQLFSRLLDLQIRPYYLHHPDQARGTEHFYLSLTAGRQIFTELRQQLPGWALPHYMVELPNGAGKTSAYNSISQE